MSRWIFVLLSAFLLAGCMKPMARLAAARPTPMVTAPSGEQTRPLTILIGAAVDPARDVPAPIAEHPLPPAFDVAPPAAKNGTAYYYDGTTLSAFDLSRGATVWHRTVQLLSDTLVATNQGVAFVQRYPAPSLYLDAKTGAERFSRQDTFVAGSLDGLVFAKNNDNSSYFALDAKTGEKLWGTYGGGMQVAGPPQIRDGTLLQLFVNDGAIIADALYAFDPSNGHAKWNTLSNTQPLGFHGDVAYVDSTWFPEQMDNYVPLSVTAIDIGTGEKIDQFTYAPDPLQNAATYRNSPSKAYVSGGFVYLEVNGTWYRYDADRSPGAAHPSRIANLDIAAALDNGTLLVSDAHGTYLARPDENVMTLHALPGGTVRSPVARDANGALYVVAGTTLYRIDAQGAARAIGAVRCANVNAVLPWPGNVAVMCARRELLFRNSTQNVAPIAVAPRRTPQGRLRLNAFALPPAPGFMHQWWVGPVTPWGKNGVVMTLDHGAMNFAGAIAYVSNDGKIRTVADGQDLPPPPRGSRVATTLPRSQWPPKPTSIAYDAGGNVWFNNVIWPAIYKLDASQRLTSTVVGETSADAWRRGAIRLTSGSDGQAWFARSHPSREIARADGSRAISIPAQYGDALVLIAARDGFWFVSQTQLVHVTFAGKFTATPLPAQIIKRYTLPNIRVTGAGDSVWIANGTYIARMNEHGVLAHYELPDATLSVNAMITGCDGSLYIAENAPEVLRLRPGASAFDRYDIDYRQLDGFTRTPDCTIWFVEGSNMPKQHVGTLNLED